ncbi:DUF427 domain-containing protein [Parasynechococcus marenigrum]|uniref:DUF427 domain-containing protein n=1 Tax=Parasynechococcus marenigrum (strain WH8102) TaxID=84588 RepID=Q7U6K9_PARMW|nr:DUF427 domain-containing protein [Parasynechococcus marenigrum]CAE07844.1 conserved hypothetical protein [Parasynechococcus marenigrum WH 8102]
MERVRDYPRPPRLDACQDQIRVEVLGEVLVETQRSLRVLETFHPPTYYLPPEAMNQGLLVPAPGRPSFCEWKGVASYYDVVAGEQRINRAVWTYNHPSERFRELAGWFALYPGQMDGCWVNGERVIPQQGEFYGGWITSQVEGPFKGDPNHPELI